MRNRAVIEKLKPVFKKWKMDYVFKTIASSLASFMITILFALYNGFLGIRLMSVWHGSICVFYLLLVFIRGIILLTEKNAGTDCGGKRYRIFIITASMLLLLDLALICPIALMVKFEKPVNMELIPSIAMAAYTTYKITMASIHVCGKRGKGHDNILITELRTINLIDALVSVLTLQNTLIMVNNEKSSADNMIILAAASSTAIYILIVFITASLLAAGRKKCQKPE